MARTAAFLMVMLLVCVSAHAMPAPAETPKPVLNIPRITVVPALEDFLEMRPGSRLLGEMAEIRDFIQREPTDGAPASDATLVYAGYDTRNIYVAFVCFDAEPARIRSGITRRENVSEDDRVHVMLDTFNDQRRGYSFITNAHGVQLDAIYSETAGSDASFDTVWHSAGRITDRGYVVLMTIPFKSLRFPATGEQRWGVFFQRINARKGESVYWPHVTNKVDGWLNQAARLDGLREISLGRNMQFNPYTVARSYRAPDYANSSFVSRMTAEAGLDSKIVLRDSLVLDTTINPDFSQVESDDPQLSVNQRYEVYYPEKRPFFLENSHYFNTPFTLLFTRRIADPQYGARLTGKMGKYTVGALMADDESAADAFDSSNPLHLKRAFFGVVRVNRDIFKQSTVGAIFTERRFGESFNRVGGIDTSLRLTDHWSALGHAVTSTTRHLDGSTQAGPAYKATLSFSDRDSFSSVTYTDISPGFISAPGYIYRTGYREIENSFSHRWRPRNKGPLLMWGPNGGVSYMWDSSGTPVERGYWAYISWSFKRQTNFGLEWNHWLETLRPSEFSVLPANRDYTTRSLRAFANIGVWRAMMFGAEIRKQARINYVPLDRMPRIGHGEAVTAYVKIRPGTRLRIDNNYSLSRLRDPLLSSGVFTSHIVRTKANWQISRELSVRLIGTYEAVLANRSVTYLRSTKSLNGDFLITYLVHPGTAVHVGYNSNMENLDRSLARDDDGYVLRPRASFINDSRQVFIKLSYLLRY